MSSPPSSLLHAAATGLLIAWGAASFVAPYWSPVAALLALLVLPWFAGWRQPDGPRAKASDWGLAAWCALALPLASVLACLANGVPLRKVDTAEFTLVLFAFAAGVWLNNARAVALGMGLGAIVILPYAIWDYAQVWQQVRGLADQHLMVPRAGALGNPITLGELSACTLILTVFLLRGRLRLAVMVVGTILVALSQTRGVWPIAALAWGLLAWALRHESAHGQPRQGQAAWRRWWPLMVLVLAGLAWMVGQRLWVTWLDVSRLSAGDVSTPTGIRLQLWKAAWMIFVDHPWFGVGSNQYVHAKAVLIDQGLIAASAPHPHAHNTLLNQLAELGLTGVFASLSIAVALVWRSIRQWHSPAAQALLWFVVAWMLAGLTQDTLAHQISARMWIIVSGYLLGCLAAERAGS